MTYDQNNVFAKIIRGELPCNKVYEDEDILAFHDIIPKAPVHVLVIPKKEYVSFDDYSANASPEEMSTFFRAIGKIARDLGVEEQGYRLIANHRGYAGQEVEHFHVHILAGQPLGPMLMPQ
ncbi:MAG: histidine triad nucleotide-binding protein [Pseudomonadota bacterium]